MRKIIFKVTLFFMVIGLLSTVILFAQTPDSITRVIDGSIESNDNELLFGSNNYTQKDDLSVNLNKGSLNSSDEEITKSASEDYTLYLNRDLGIFKVKNNITGYVYSTGLDTIDDTSCSAVYARYLSSSIVVYYYKYNTKDEKLGSDTLQLPMTQAKKLSNSDKEANPQDSYNYELSQASTVRVTYTNIENGIKMGLSYPSVQISLNVYVTLTDEGLNVKIPDNEISEEKNLISNIIVFPAMGSTYNNTTPGYMIIPDGSGALIRYGQIAQAKQQTLPFYDSDYGISKTIRNYDAKRDEVLNLPIFGLVNGIKQDACYGIVNGGVYSAELVINPCGGLNIKHNFLTVSFKKRYRYLLYGVNEVIQPLRDSQDIETLYRFLSNDSASYVGVSNDFKDYLKDNGGLNTTADNQYKTLITFLMSEVTKGIIGNKVIEMTSYDSASKILSELNSAGVDNMTVVLEGWNKSGFSASTPYNIKYNSKCGSKSDFKNLIKQIEENYGKCYVYNDYVTGYKDGNISLRADVARGVNNLKLSFDYDKGGLTGESHDLYPSSTYSIAIKDIKKYDKLGINSLALDSIGEFSYSYIQDGKTYQRSNSIEWYDKTLSELSKSLDIALFDSNCYFFKYLDDYLNIQMYSSAYTFYTDCVPLIHYILRGDVNYYSDYINFQANGTTQLLRMLDFGAYPSYILTNEASYNLKYTMSNTLYTTKYLDFKQKIIDNNAFLEDGYNEVMSKSIVDRTVLDSGVVLQEYSDGSKLVINYSSNSYTYNSVVIEGHSYKVM